MQRISLTPGKLFARLSAEFRRRRGHVNCRMPMVVLSHRVAPDAANWTLEPSQAACEACLPMVMAIAHEAMEQYDLRDPTSMPTWPAGGTPLPTQTGMNR